MRMDCHLLVKLQTTALLYLLIQGNIQNRFMGDCVSRPTQKDNQRNVERQTFSVNKMVISEAELGRSRASKAKTEDEMYQLLSDYYDKYDINGSDSLSFEEILKMLKEIQAKANKKRKRNKIEIDMAEARSFFTRMDVNGDNCISKEQFYRFYKNM